MGNPDVDARTAFQVKMSLLNHSSRKGFLAAAKCLSILLYLAAAISLFLCLRDLPAALHLPGVLVIGARMAGLLALTVCLAAAGKVVNHGCRLLVDIHDMLYTELNAGKDAQKSKPESSTDKSV